MTVFDEYGLPRIDARIFLRRYEVDAVMVANVGIDGDGAAAGVTKLDVSFKSRSARNR